MPSKAPTQTVDARITQLRQWISRADGEGVARADMQLNLSHRDLAGLKRSPDVRLEEITFVDGVMRFIGVEVIAAATVASSLDLRQPAE